MTSKGTTYFTNCNDGVKLILLTTLVTAWWDIISKSLILQWIVTRDTDLVGRSSLQTMKPSKLKRTPQLTHAVTAREKKVMKISDKFCIPCCFNQGLVQIAIVTKGNKLNNSLIEMKYGGGAWKEKDEHESGKMMIYEPSPPGRNAINQWLTRGESITKRWILDKSPHHLGETVTLTYLYYWRANNHKSVKELQILNFGSGMKIILWRGI